MRLSLMMLSLLFIQSECYGSAHDDRVAADGVDDAGGGRKYCSSYSKVQPVRDFDADVGAGRARAIIMSSNKWPDGKTLNYYFFEDVAEWKGSASDKDVARQGFAKWMNVGIGIKFKEVSNKEDAEIRIGFMQNDGAWSYLGNYALNIPKDERTMNLGWQELDTAIHEIGHALGLPHEHQNPNAGIVWNELAIIADLKGPPNYWPEDVTRSNIIDKINPDEVQGSNWDKDSIMHYPFDAGHILQPVAYQTQDLVPAPGLSERDKKWIRSFYPPLEEEVVSLSLGENAINLEPGESKIFTLTVPKTSYYSIRTLGNFDTLLTLFDPYEKEIQTDDDSGYSTNAKIVEAIFTGHEYTVSTRLYWKNEAGDFRIVVEDEGIS